MPPLICLVEDEIELAELVTEYLNANDFKTQVFHRGDDANEWLKHNEPALLLLDIMLPGMDGLQICRQQRQRSSAPIIMVTAKVEEVDRLVGLELGADDYICKPFSAREVVARVKAVLRRTQPAPDQGQPAPSAALVALEPDSLSVVVNQHRVELTHIEFQLFKLLQSQPGRIFSRQYILDNIYKDYRIVGDRTVDGHIKKLRKKLTVAMPDDVDLIRSVYGCGYKFEALWHPLSWPVTDASPPPIERNATTQPPLSSRLTRWRVLRGNLTLRSSS